MKKNDRLKALLQFLEESPDDPFTLYGIALEYAKTDAEEARKYFDILLSDHSDYLPAYYKAGEFYQDLGETEKALEIYNGGIALAEKIKDIKTLAELKNAHQNLLFELD